MLTEWRKTPPEDRSEELQEQIDVTEESLEDFETHQSYAQSIMDHLADGNRTSFAATDQVDQVISTFESYTSDRSIQPINDVDSDIETPKLNVGLYVGVLTNLYTNAMKAVLEEGVGDEGRIIRFAAENSEEWHKIRVMDNGSGMTEEEKTRIFEPWFSESTVEGPLGIGHGLGLYIVDKVVGEVNGEIELVEPPKDFETAFEVRYPR
jgi:signal transduction histidine kinase